MKFLKDIDNDSFAFLIKISRYPATNRVFANKGNLFNELYNCILFNFKSYFVSSRNYFRFLNLFKKDFTNICNKYNTKITFGIIQKWINLLSKYLVIGGYIDKKIVECPIDRKILINLKLLCTYKNWSKLSSYDYKEVILKAKEYCEDNQIETLFDYELLQWNKR